MTKFYCDYCDTFLTHDSPSVRKTHNGGRKHKENVRMFNQKWMEAQAQKLVDATASAFAVRALAMGSGGPMGPPCGIPPMIGGIRPPTGMHPMTRGMRPFHGSPMGGIPLPPPHYMALPPMGHPSGYRHP